MKKTLKAISVSALAVATMFSALPIQSAYAKEDTVTKEKTGKKLDLSNLQGKIKELEKQIALFKTNDANKTKELDKIKKELQDTKTLLDTTQKN